jgi:hypothetical protein
MVGTLGWLTIWLPSWIVLSYLALFLSAAATRPSLPNFTPAIRGWTLLFVVAAGFNVMAGTWMINQTKNFVDALNMPEINLWDVDWAPIQGRYWIPVVFPLFVLVSNQVLRSRRLYVAAFAALVILVSNAIGLQMVISHYYL